MLKLRYDLTCDGCGKSESIEYEASYDPWWAAPQPRLPRDWKEIAGAHYCPDHMVSIQVHDGEASEKLYFDSVRKDSVIIR